MAIRHVDVQRFSVTSSAPFADVVAKVDAGIGHTDFPELARKIGAAGTYADVQQLVQAVIGSSELVEFLRLDIGGVLQKAAGPTAPRSLRLIVGNPVTMQKMASKVPDAASYAPVTILIDERADGVHLSYDRMQSFLAPYGDEAALAVARDLDAHVEALLTSATKGG